MIAVVKSSERGTYDHGWLDTRHTFSFGAYHDPARMGFRSLRVINEDWIRPGAGFGEHGHRDMEIVTLVLDGVLAHRDNLGHVQALRPGELQRMTAGTGIRHSEFNHSEAEPVHLYQIWLRPERPGLEPSYEQKEFPAESRRNRLHLVAAPGGPGGALAIRQDARLYLGDLEPGSAVDHALAPGRHAWLQVLRGEVSLQGEPLTAGDGAAISEESGVSIRAEGGPAEVLLFDLA